MRPRFLILALLSCLAHWQAGYAQIAVNESYQLGEPIVATAEGDKSAAFDWRAQNIVTLPGGVEVLGLDEAQVIADGAKAFIWSKPGKYRVELTIATVADGRAVLSRHHATFTVGEVPPVPVPPEPEPDKPDVPAPTTKATAATYFYEKDETPVPNAVMAALNTLNSDRKIKATLFEDDNTDGAGDVPEQYKAALAAAREAGLPALVVSAGDNVLVIVRKPTTVEEILEAVK